MALLNLVKNSIVSLMSGKSVYWYQWEAKVPFYNCSTVNLLLYVH